MLIHRTSTSRYMPLFLISRTPNLHTKFVDMHNQLFRLSPTGRQESADQQRRTQGHRARPLGQRPGETNGGLKFDRPGHPGFTLLGNMLHHGIHHGDAARRVSQPFGRLQRGHQFDPIGDPDRITGDDSTRRRGRRFDRRRQSRQAAVGWGSGTTFLASSRWICFHIGDGAVSALRIDTVR